mmetsp:Transcript_23917/g.60048  ORF Transcript_23917/g.60048 Transcript_23917/m.60048 type:complete len:232 (-) Transcript_23917:452-1147(-)
MSSSGFWKSPTALSISASSCPTGISTEISLSMLSEGSVDRMASMLVSRRLHSLQHLHAASAPDVASLQLGFVVAPSDSRIATPATVPAVAVAPHCAHLLRFGLGDVVEKEQSACAVPLLHPSMSIARSLTASCSATTLVRRVLTAVLTGPMRAKASLRGVSLSLIVPFRSCVSERILPEKSSGTVLMLRSPSKTSSMSPGISWSEAKPTAEKDRSITKKMGSATARHPHVS